MKKFILTFSFVLVLVARSWATPPFKIELTYDKETQVLTIKVYHPSRNNRVHYIRRIFIYKNDEEVTKDGFPAQEAWGIKDEMKVPAKSGDTLRVKAICSDTGSKEETLVIP